MINRNLIEFGFHPIVGYLFGLLVFMIIATLLFERTVYAPYVLILISISIVLKLNEIERVNFLKLQYSKKEFYYLRILENLIVSIPFIGFLIFKEKYLFSVLLLISSCLLAVLDIKSKTNFTIPTPFYKQPFEFIICFRTNYFIFFFAWFLTFMAITEKNFNLGIFSLLLVLFVVLINYLTLENEFYIWIFSLTSLEFIRYKLKYIIQYSTILCLPIIIALSVFFYQQITIILSFLCLGFLFIFTTMLAKYSVFPDKLNFRFYVILALLIWLPFLLVIIIPYLFIQSKKKLKVILQ